MQTGFPGLQIGALHLAYFGLIVLAGFAALIVVTWIEARRRGQEGGVAFDVGLTGFVWSIIVGRLVYVLFPPPSVAIYYSPEWFLGHWSDLLVGPLAIWSGGLDSAGLLLGAIGGARWALWRRRLDLRLWGDCLAMGGLAFLAIAPWANIVNRQLLGPSTSLPWGVPIEHRVYPIDDLALYPQDARFHPTPAYVALWAVAALVIVAGLSKFSRWKTAPGGLLALALMLTLPALFLADFLRLDVARPAFGITLMQAVAGVMWFGAAASLALHAKRASPIIHEIRP